MTDRYQALRDAIEAGPTPGARFQGRSPHAYCVYDKQCWYAPDGSRHGETPNLVVTVSPDDAEADAQFITAADPDTIRELLGERDALREALEWYSAQAKRMGNAAIRQDSQAILVMMKEIAVDYGGRARKALNPQVDTTGSQP